MTNLNAATNERLLGRGPYAITEPTYDWSRDWQIVAARALELVSNDPFAAAMVQCKLDNTHGPEGLRTVSLAQSDITKPVSQADHNLRQSIEQGITKHAGVGFDAAGILTRKQFERHLDYLATVMGEAYAVRVHKPGRINTPFYTAWRLVRPERVSNPDARPNSEKLFHGWEYDDDGQVVAIHVEITKRGDFGIWSDRKWTRIPWHNPDGTRNVAHRVGWRIPGSPRGISMFTPMLLLAKQIGGTIEAHVTAKRAQACNPVIYFVDDPKAAAEAARADANSVLGPHTKFNPLQVYFAQLGSQVQFNNPNFNGADLDAFLTINYRVSAAVWQMPIEVVLCMMGKASLASARAGLDQVDRTAQNWQNDSIEQFSVVADSATTAEMVARDMIAPGASGLAGLQAFRYTRPPKYSTDRLKDASTVKALREAGASPTTALATVGLDFEDETDQAIRDELYRRNARQAAGLPPDDAAPATQTAQDAEKTNADGKTPPPVSDDADEPATIGTP